MNRSHSVVLSLLSIFVFSGSAIAQNLDYQCADYYQSQTREIRGRRCEDNGIVRGRFSNDAVDPCDYGAYVYGQFTQEDLMSRPVRIPWEDEPEWEIEALNDENALENSGVQSFTTLSPGNQLVFYGNQPTVTVSRYATNDIERECSR